MATCPLLEGCCFFNDICENMPSSSDYLKSRYCKEDYRECARYYVYQNTSGEGVPSSLFPHEMEKTEKILREYKYYREST